MSKDIRRTYPLAAVTPLLPTAKKCMYNQYMKPTTREIRSRTNVAALAGNALLMAGPNPFHKAPTPSAAIVFRAQSMNPAYVPSGALCSLDFKT